MAVVAQDVRRLTRSAQSRRAWPLTLAGACTALSVRRHAHGGSRVGSFAHDAAVAARARAESRLYCLRTGRITRFGARCGGGGSWSPRRGADAAFAQD